MAGEELCGRRGEMKFLYTLRCSLGSSMPWNYAPTPRILLTLTLPVKRSVEDKDTDAGSPEYTEIMLACVRAVHMMIHDYSKDDVFVSDRNSPAQSYTS